MATKKHTHDERCEDVCILDETITGKTTAKDFFLWFGFIITFYASVISLITLLFSYIDVAYPDPLDGYVDPYSGAIRFAMATLIVLTPIAVALMHTIRIGVQRDPTKRKTWIRHWSIILTIFLAGVTLAVDVITLINTFLGGEISVRFILKIAIVALLSVGIFLHFLADSKGYWIKNGKKSAMLGISVLVLCFLSIASGFLIVGSPQTVRMLRYDSEKVQDIQNIEYQVVTYFQQKETVPASLVELSDPLSGNTIPVDPQTLQPYEYRATGATSFEICANFNEPSPVTDQSTMDKYAYNPAFTNGNLQHGTGRTCFPRTIDPERYPPLRETRPL